MLKPNKSEWKGMLVAAACAVALSIFTPFAGMVPVVALQQFAQPKPRESEINNLVKQLGTEATRWNAIEKLARIGEPAVRPLIQALSNKNDLVRVSASFALAKIGEPAVRPLIGSLYNNDGEIRKNASWALGRIGNKEAVLPLIEVLKKDPSVKIQVQAAESLGSLASAGSMTLPQLRETKAGIGVLEQKIDDMSEDGTILDEDRKIYNNIINSARAGLNAAAISMTPKRKEQ